MTEHSDVLTKLKKASNALDEAQVAAKETAAAVSNAKRAVDKAKKHNQLLDTSGRRDTHVKKAKKKLPRTAALKKRR
jgi:hypothetical protein